MKLAVVMMAFSLVAHPQTAKVIALTPAEATQAKALHEQQAAITAKIEELRLAIIKAHLVEHAGAKPSTCAYAGGGYIAEGWGCGGLFEYSSDFRFIVPAQAAHVSSFTLGGPCSYAYPVDAVYRFPQ